jgi:hypothetical protein
MPIVIDHKPVFDILTLKLDSEADYKAALDKLIAALPIESQLGLMLWIQERAQDATQDRLMVVYARAMVVAGKLLTEERAKAL